VVPGCVAAAGAEAQAAIRRHRFRGEVWYVVQDPASGRFNRLTPAAYQLLGLMNGERTMKEVWDAAIEQLATICRPGRGHPAAVAAARGRPAALRSESRFERAVRAVCKAGSGPQQEQLAQSVQHPLAAVESGPLPVAHAAVPAPLFGRFGALLYCAIVGFALVLGALHWPELTRNLADRALAFDNLVILWLCFPW
jgi:putative peptide zinc metalloprotease protein